MQKLFRKGKRVKTKKQEIKDNENYLARLHSEIAEIKRTYPDLELKMALKNEVASLKRQVEELKGELKDINDQCLLEELVYENLTGTNVIIADIAREKKALETELSELKKLRLTTFDPCKLLLVAYTNLSSKELRVGIFYYDKEIKYTLGANGVTKYLGFVYRSVDEDYTIGFANGFEGGLTNGRDENDFNAMPLFHLTLPDACEKIGSNLCTYERVSLDDIKAFLVSFLEQYEFKRKMGGVTMSSR